MRCSLGAVLAMLLVAVPAAAQPDKALDLVPHDALGFILIKDLRQLSENVERLAKKLNAPEHVSLLELIQKQMGIPTGVNEKGSALLIIPKGTKEGAFPEPILAIPVTDYQAVLRHLGAEPGKDKGGISEGTGSTLPALLAGVGGEPSKDKPGEASKRPVLIARKGDFALLASPENRELLTQVLAAKQGITEGLRASRDWLLEQDICGVCTHNGVKVGLAMLLASPAGIAGDSTQGQHAKMKATFTEMEKNVELLAFGARLEEAGHARLLARAYFNPDGPYAKWMAKAEPLRRGLLTRFPDRPYFATAFARISPQVALPGIRLLYPDKLPPEKTEELTKTALALIQRTSEIGLSVFPVQSDDRDPAKSAPTGNVSDWPVQATFLAKVDDAPAFIEGVTALVKNSFQEARAVQATRAEATVRPLQVAGKPAQLLTIQEEKKEKADSPNKESEVQGMKLVILLVALDSQTVLAGLLPDASRADPLMKLWATPPMPSLGESAPLQKTTTLLPEPLQTVVYLGMPTVGAFFLHGEPRGSEIPPLAFALRTLPAGAEAQFLIPFDTLRAVFETFAPKEGSKK